MSVFWLFGKVQWPQKVSRIISKYVKITQIYTEYHCKTNYRILNSITSFCEMFCLKVFVLPLIKINGSLFDILLSIAMAFIYYYECISNRIFLGSLYNRKQRSIIYLIKVVFPNSLFSPFPPYQMFAVVVYTLFLSLHSLFHWRTQKPVRHNGQKMLWAPWNWLQISFDPVQTHNRRGVKAQR